MQISSRVSMAVHILVLLNNEDAEGRTSEAIAGSVNTNPVVIRRIEAMLKEAGLIRIERGKKGAQLAKRPEDISLRDIYQAVSEAEKDKLFKFHDDPNLMCSVGANIQEAVEGSFVEAQTAMEMSLSRVTVRDIVDNVERLRTRL